MSHMEAWDEAQQEIKSSWGRDFQVISIQLEYQKLKITYENAFFFILAIRNYDNIEEQCVNIFL